MRPARVVIAHPVIERGLGLKQRRERRGVVEQLALQRLMEALDLARSGRLSTSSGTPERSSASLKARQIARPVARSTTRAITQNRE